jgi:hypothetical protein
VSVGWNEVTSQAWVEALRRQPWQERYDSDDKRVAYTLRVPCPRCGHKGAIDLEFRLKILSDRGAPPPVLHREKYVQCECVEEHPGRPAEETGCGARSSIKFTLPTGTDQ